MASAGTTYAHTASDAVGWSSSKNCTPKVAAVKVQRGGDLPNPPPGPRWGVTFADGRGSTRKFHTFQRVGVDEGLRRARVQEGDSAELWQLGRCGS